MLTNESHINPVYTGKNVTIEIDPKAGFCFGVTRAVALAESLVQHNAPVYCVGDIVHNQVEQARLEKLGVHFISMEELKNQSGKKVLFRAHGEAPESYSFIKQNQHQLTDATCPVVLKLQQRIKNAWEEQKKSQGQIVIFGKKKHAEVVGLKGQTNNEAIIVESANDLPLIDFNRPIVLFTQTTMSIDAFHQLSEMIQQKAQAGVKINDTVCRQVSGREPWLAGFVKPFDRFVFVGGAHSSNARFLFEVCKNNNPGSVFISDVNELNSNDFINIKRIGISGATSTPLWQLHEVAGWLHQKLN